MSKAIEINKEITVNNEVPPFNIAGSEQYADYYIKCIKCAAEVGIIKIK